MLNLATVFSGIGAIEHAIERMGIKYNIIFACDNGDVDIFKKNIVFSLISIEKEILRLKENFCDFDNLEYREIFIELCELEKKLNYIKNIEILSVKESELLDKFLESINLSIYNSKYITCIYEKYSENELYVIDKLLILENLNKYCNINILFENEMFKNIKLELKYILQTLYDLNERIQSFKIRESLKNLNSFYEKKRYVDSIYNKCRKTNFVKKSYFANYKVEEKDFHWNASFIDGNFYRDKVDILVGGSPCQSFSSVGKQKGLKDTRGTLFYEYARLVNEIKPKVFIYENVKAVLNNDNGDTWKVMESVFNQIGYNWTFMNLNSKDFGVPQSRERIFVVGFRKDIVLNGTFKEPKKKKLNKYMQDILIDNEIEDKNECCEILKKYFISEKSKKYILSRGTKNFYAKPEIDLKVARPLLKTMHKMHRAGVDNYVTTNGKLRRLTPRECLRLMGFSDEFKIIVSDTQMYKQVGNSIVIDILIEIMKSIIDVFPNIIE